MMQTLPCPTRTRREKRQKESYVQAASSHGNSNSRASTACIKVIINSILVFISELNLIHHSWSPPLLPKLALHAPQCLLEPPTKTKTRPPPPCCTTTIATTATTATAGHHHHTILNPLPQKRKATIVQLFTLFTSQPLHYEPRYP